MKKIFLILSGLIVLLLLPKISEAQNSANEIYNSKLDSMVYLETQSTSGSGVILKEDGTFLTCFHIIDDADYIKVTTSNGKTYKVNGYRYINPKDDIAILTLATKKSFKPITLNSKELSVGDNVYAFSNPKGIKFVFSNGMINQLSDNEILFSAPASSGSSGGALLNEKGELIGIIGYQYNPSVAQNINFAIPNKFYEKYLNKRKKLNSKNMVWTDFLMNRATKKQLNEYSEYAYNINSPSTAYRYLKPVTGKETIPPEKYAYWGTLALGAFLASDIQDMNILKEGEEMLKLSVENNKNIELASFGLIFKYFIENDKDNMEYYLKYLKKYPKSYRFMKKEIKIYEKCSNTACAHDTISDILEYHRSLFKKTHFE